VVVEELQPKRLGAANLQTDPLISSVEIDVAERHRSTECSDVALSPVHINITTTLHLSLSLDVAERIQWRSSPAVTTLSYKRIGKTRGKDEFVGESKRIEPTNVSS
jgi:hypothetical protein